jgi:hypothetical protein
VGLGQESSAGGKGPENNLKINPTTAQPKDQRMNKLKPKTAEDNPLAAALLGAVLVKAGRQDNSQSSIDAGMELIKTAEANQDKMPTLPANSKMAEAIRAMRAGTSRTSSLLSPSEIESLRQEAKADDLRMQEILAKQSRSASTGKS